MQPHTYPLMSLLNYFEPQNLAFQWYGVSALEEDMLGGPTSGVVMAQQPMERLVG